MSSLRPHSAPDTHLQKGERRPGSRAFSDPLAEIASDGHDHAHRRHGSRKGMRLSLIILSGGAVCAFGFGLLLELFG